MNFATTTNVAVMLLCVAVLVQSVRMMRALKTIKAGAMTEVVEALDRATGDARAVLSELKVTLGACAGGARVMTEGRALAEELGVMIGIADATAERLMTAAGTANRQPVDAWDAVSDYVAVDSGDDVPDGAGAATPRAVAA